MLSDELLSWAYLLTKGYKDEAEVERIMEKVPDISYFERVVLFGCIGEGVLRIAIFKNHSISGYFGMVLFLT